jgi:hypothetical protein
LPGAAAFPAGNGQTDDLGEDNSDLANDSAKSKGFVDARRLLF